MAGWELTQADCSLVGCGQHKSPALLMEGGKTVSGDQFSESSVHCILSGELYRVHGKMPEVKVAVTEVLCPLIICIFEDRGHSWHNLFRVMNNKCCFCQLQYVIYKNVLLYMTVHRSYLCFGMLAGQNMQFQDVTVGFRNL